MNRIEELEAEVARLRERVAALEEELGFAMMIADNARRRAGDAPKEDTG